VRGVGWMYPDEWLAHATLSLDAHLSILR
jgi:hypothetical protein